MKVKYKWHKINKGQKIIHEFLLHDQSQKQNWYAVVYLKLWKSVGLICIQ